MEKRERIERIKNQYHAAKLERRANKGMEQFPDDPSDEARRLKIIMEQMDKKGLLNQEEKEKVFGQGGYLEQAEQRADESRKVVKIKGKSKKKSEKSVWHRAAKWASVAAIFCVSIVVLTMSSEANREYVKDTVQYYVGDDGVVKSSGEEDNVVRGVSEAEMRADIKKKLNIEVPVFQYKPQGMKFDGYTLYESDRVALVYYIIRGRKLVLDISEKDANKNHTKFYTGKEIDTIWTDYTRLAISIFEDSDENSQQKSYCAKWKEQEVNYRLSGSVEKEEFYKILKKMMF